MSSPRGFPALLQAFFTERLLTQRNASAHTVAAYRDCFRLLLGFARKRLRKAPTELALEDLAAPFIGRFLDHLERERRNGARTRNVRLAAIHSFFRYVAENEPAYAAVCHRVLAIPSKRAVRRLVAFLLEDEIAALVNAPDATTWMGRRDRTLLLTAVQTGLRASEITGLRVQDVAVGTSPHIRCHGKGRKERCTPLRRDATALLRAWLRERNGAAESPLFPTRSGDALSRDAVAGIVQRHAVVAGRACPTIQKKRVTPHVLRHSAAMTLLRSGVDCSVIALWLGHESVETTSIYLHADLSIKERALSRTPALGAKPGRYRPDDRLLTFLEDL